MRGLIILDGPDGAGKTTLAKSVAHRVESLGSQAEIVHLGAPEPGTAWQVQIASLFSNLKEAFAGLAGVK